MAEYNFYLELIDLTNNFIELLIDKKLINEMSVRNFKINLRYNQLVQTGIVCKEARETVSSEFYLSDKTIQKIIYNK